MTLTLEKTWHEALKTELSKPYISDLKSFLDSEKRSGATIYPPEDEVFNALRLTPFDAVKVVIVGQDPYHGPGQAHGLCFSVKPGIKPPPSLVNIYKELRSDIGMEIPTHGNLESWAGQGVLMLNATLTVRRGEPKSHYGRGWEQFTDAVVQLLFERSDPVVFVLWGRSAREKCERIFATPNHPHLILESAHPSPFSATKFFGCRHFSKINQALEKWGKSPINWSL
ncbi:MAG: uracil-DNA glycosylase [Simkaniaceae bacterium]|nr:uracil-DNA glycosylase [Simkaniaceae bacterium]